MIRYQVKCVDFDAPFVELPEGSIVVEAEAMLTHYVDFEKISLDEKTELECNPDRWRITYLEPVEE